jgi:hypothetical protein
LTKDMALQTIETVRIHHTNQKQRGFNYKWIPRYRTRRKSIIERIHFRCLLIRCEKSADNKVDLISKVETMHPIQINATDVKVSNVNYSEQTKEIILDLTDRHGLSTLSIKIPKSIIEDIREGYECHSKNNVSTSNLTVPEIPYEVDIMDIQRHENYNVMIVQLQADALKIFNLE